MEEEKRDMKWQRYTEAEDAVIEAGHKLGLTASQIADKLPGRTRDNVYAHARTLGLTLHTKRKRRKLKPWSMPDNGTFGTRANQEEKPVWTAWMEEIAKVTGPYLHDMIGYAIEAGAERSRRERGLGDG